MAEKEDEKPGWGKILQDLQRGIILGSIHPRQRLIEDEILEEIPGSTRHSVRKALDELEKSGLVVRHLNKGVQVRAYTKQEIEELYEIRTCLETQACKRINAPVDAATIEHLKDLANRHRTASQASRVIDTHVLNDEFHHALYCAAGNKQLADIIRHYSMITQPIRTRGITDEIKEVAIKEHGQLVALAAMGNGQEMAEIVGRHLQRPLDLYIATLPPGVI